MPQTVAHGRGKKRRTGERNVRPQQTLVEEHHEMNERLILFVAVVCCTNLTACKERPQSPIVTAEAYQEFHTTMSDSHDSSPIAYRVNVTVKNTGSSPIVFDTIVCAFVPANGRPLINKTYVYDKTKGKDEKSYNSDLKTDAIEPGTAKTFSSTTDGYTFKLLGDAGNLPLQFVFTLYRGDSTPAISAIGSHGADLPDIQALPRYNVPATTRGKELSLQLR